MNRVPVLSTDGVPAAQRFDFWRDLVSEMTMPIQVHSEYAGDFAATVQSHPLGAIEILRMRHRPIVVDRGRRLIRRSDPEVVHLVLSLAGHQRISQDRGEVVLRPGDMTLYSSSRVFRTYPEPELSMESAVVAVVPRSMLPFARLDDLLTVRFDPDEALAGLVGAHLLALARNPAVEPADAVRLSTITVDLIGLLLARRLGAGDRVTPEVRDTAGLARAQAFIDRHLADPRLTPALVAAAHHVSARSLHRLFQAHGLTVSAWIRGRRLERCRHDLVDPGQFGVPIQAIAARWCFPQAAHFSRLFRQEYGLTPREFREAARTGVRGAP
jgi:AraC-like DNA-binding protein